MIILIVEIESSLLSVGTVSALVHVDTPVLTDEIDLLISMNEKVMSLMTLLHVFCNIMINYYKLNNL